ncbi:MAG: cytochrome c peroxidase [Pelobium sp.]
MNSKTIIFLSLATFLLVSFKMSPNDKEAIGVPQTVAYFNEHALLFVESTVTLEKAIEGLSKDSSSLQTAKEALKDCRLKYKRIEFFSEYFFPSVSKIYNAAPKYEVEEPELEFVEPAGLQQIEALLFDEDIIGSKASLIAQVALMRSSAQDIKSLMYNFKANDDQVLESVRMEWLRMMTLSVTGYDAPNLKSGLAESFEVACTLKEVLAPYFKNNERASKKISSLLDQVIHNLQSSKNSFDSFDRLKFYKDEALPIQKEIGHFISRLNLTLNTTSLINYDADDLFSPDFLKNWDTDSGYNKIAMNALGEKLFFDKRLSANSTISCANCHQPENYFSDLLVKSPSAFPDSILKRNTPTLLYAGWQHQQFWDGRANNLKEQVKTVLFNPLEMGDQKDSSYKKLFKDKSYSSLLKDAFPARTEKNISIDEIALAIAQYVKQLHPLNSSFDQYIRGNSKAMDENQKRGFNLFMGKAQCGTCHFPPYFNGLLPPYYEISELEILGVTETEDFKNPKPDHDLGRYDLYPIKYYNKAFKTPTVRNAAKTAPYMHNGSFKSLETLMEFYNQGGGAGLGLSIEEQSLSSTPLLLTAQEIKDVIAFIQSLTDHLNVNHTKI